jgi:hypothetical protein
MVTTATRDALVVIFAPAEIERPPLEFVLHQTASRIGEIAGGSEGSRSIV